MTEGLRAWIGFDQYGYLEPIAELDRCAEQLIYFANVATDLVLRGARHGERRVLVGYTGPRIDENGLSCLTEPLRQQGVQVVVIERSFPPMLGLLGLELGFNLVLYLEQAQTRPSTGGYLIEPSFRVQVVSLLGQNYTPQTGIRFLQASERVESSVRDKTQEGQVIRAEGQSAYFDKVFHCTAWLKKIWDERLGFDQTEQAAKTVWLVGDTVVQEAISDQGRFLHQFPNVQVYGSRFDLEAQTEDAIVIKVDANGQELREFSLSRGQLRPIPIMDMALAIASLIEPVVPSHQRWIAIQGERRMAPKLRSWGYSFWQNKTLFETAQTSKAAILIDQNCRIICRTPQYLELNDAVYAGMLLLHGRRLQSLYARYRQSSDQDAKR